MEEEKGLKKEKKNIPVLPWMRNPVDITTFEQCSVDLLPFIDPRYSFSITPFNPKNQHDVPSIVGSPFQFVYVVLT